MHNLKQVRKFNMPERNFADDLRILVTAYLPIISSLPSVQQLVLSQNAIFLEMHEAHAEKAALEKQQNDLG